MAKRSTKVHRFLICLFRYTVKFDFHHENTQNIAHKLKFFLQKIVKKLDKFSQKIESYIHESSAVD